MINHYDIAYGLGVGLSSPFWLAHPAARRKVLRAFSQRMGQVQGRDLSKPGIMVHAVSLGEINATRSLIDVLRSRRPGINFIVSVTTETGFARGQELYGSAADVTLVRYPLDFTSAVDRLLITLRPSLVALLELEVWPNFIRRCAQRNVPVILINGRITPGSFRRYRLAQRLVGSMFARLHHVAAQDQIYAERFAELGVRQNRISVTGTMKFDNAPIADRLPGQDELAAAVGLSPGKDLVWVCGSTGPGEEEIILPIYRGLLNRFADLRLVIVPRKPERFDEVAQMISGRGFSVVRRSRPGETPPASDLPAVILGDTIGELRKFYALASVVFVGRTLVDLGYRQHGSDMIEPAALAKPVVVGPFTANFAEAMNCFRQADAMMVVQTPQELERAIEILLSDPGRATTIGRRAREVVKAQQGATQRHADLILDTLDSVLTMSRP
ncbi:MAG: 3-deoxy-D-manno-octulosonic acid transferase [Tepidisphaeraceae bacterium]|jgi:3-deoxy-D-manno-octulosonic-acid transferase